MIGLALPFRHPSLLEDLCLSFWWEEAVVGQVEFASNPASNDLIGFAEAVRNDRHLWDYLVPHGYLVFGRMSGGRYDPCAFEMKHRRGGDAPLVRVDHEQILSFERLGKPTPLSGSLAAFLSEHLRTS